MDVKVVVHRQSRVLAVLAAVLTVLTSACASSPSVSSTHPRTLSARIERVARINATLAQQCLIELAATDVYCESVLRGAVRSAMQKHDASGLSGRCLASVRAAVTSTHSAAVQARAALSLYLAGTERAETLGRAFKRLAKTRRKLEALSAC